MRPGRRAFLGWNALLGERGGDLPQRVTGGPQLDHQADGPLFGGIGHQGLAVVSKIVAEADLAAPLAVADFMSPRPSGTARVTRATPIPAARSRRPEPPSCTLCPLPKCSGFSGLKEVK
jgi:hypothetical protein